MGILYLYMGFVGQIKMVESVGGSNPAGWVVALRNPVPGSERTLKMNAIGISSIYSENESLTNRLNPFPFSPV